MLNHGFTALHHYDAAKLEQVADGAAILLNYKPDTGGGEFDPMLIAEASTVDDSVDISAVSHGDTEADVESLAGLGFWCSNDALDGGHELSGDDDSADSAEKVRPQVWGSGEMHTEHEIDDANKMTERQHIFE